MSSRKAGWRQRSRKEMHSLFNSDASRWKNGPWGDYRKYITSQTQAANRNSNVEKVIVGSKQRVQGWKQKAAWELHRRCDQVSRSSVTQTSCPMTENAVSFCLFCFQPEPCWDLYQPGRFTIRWITLAGRSLQLGLVLSATPERRWRDTPMLHQASPHSGYRLTQLNPAGLVRFENAIEIRILLAHVNVGRRNTHVLASHMTSRVAISYA